VYHSVKGSSIANNNGIRHRVSTDGGKTWGTSELVLTTGLQPGTDPAESIAGKYFPNLLGPVRCAFFTMDSAVLGLGSSGCGWYTVRVSRQESTLEDAIGSHACSLEALASVRPMAFLSDVHSSYRFHTVLCFQN
jgi:hypothetical protein